MDNESVDVSSTVWTISDIENSSEAIESLTRIVKLILCITCIFAVIVNLKVFACIHWIRRPLNSILKISLSLALADSCASCLSAVMIFYESFMTTRNYIIVEIVRLCFILVTVFHLLGLGFNHYMGIRKPLSHNSRLTQQGISRLLVLLWMIPIVFTLLLYTFEGGTSFWDALINDKLIHNKMTKIFNATLFINDSSYSINNTIAELNRRVSLVEMNAEHNEMPEKHIMFLETFRFRMFIASFIIISMLLIVLCYIWILIMIKRQHKIWKELSRSGSTVWRGHNCRRVAKEKTHEQNKIKGNFRAVYTTLIILGSCFLGWMPALLLFIFTCNRDCLISGELLMTFNEHYPRLILVVRFFDNEMLLLKMIANPIIYSIRIKEIKEGTRQMHNVIMYHLCGKQCSKKYNRGSKSSSLKSLKEDKIDIRKRRKPRLSVQASYL